MNSKETVLVDLERIAYAVYGLMEETIEPMFRGMKLDGLLQEIIKEEGCKSREAAALSWMEDHFDSLSCALSAVGAMAELLVP